MKDKVMKIENTETPTAGQTEQVEVKNPAALLAKNKELLRELADTKAALQIAQDALGTAQSAHTKTAEQLHSVRVTEPLVRIVSTLSNHPGLMKKCLNDLFDVKLDADSNPVLLDKKGQPLTWTRTGKHGVTEEVPVALERESMVQWILNGFEGNPDGPQALMFKAQGTGATGSSVASHKRTARPVPPPPPPAPLTPLGLR